MQIPVSQKANNYCDSSKNLAQKIGQTWIGGWKFISQSQGAARREREKEREGERDHYMSEEIVQPHVGLALLMGDSGGDCGTKNSKPTNFYTSFVTIILFSWLWFES